MFLFIKKISPACYLHEILTALHVFFLLQKTLSLGCILRMKNPILAAVASVQLFCR